MSKILLFVLLALMLCSVPAFAATAPETYTKVIVSLESAGAEALLRDYGVLDVRIMKPGSYAELIATEADLAWLNASGLDFKIEIEDLTRFYVERLGVDKAEGNYGDFHCWSEVVDWLDELHTLYPDVVSAKWSLGQSHEGRDLWCVRLSDNPEIDETGEAEVLFDGMHHAREIMASETCMMLAEYLATRYGSNPDITYLLDTREIYIVPVVNPDGSVYNETTNPSGGGMWRKNRRDNGDGTFGVDPNRNYTYEWIGTGSSTSTSDETYRGPYAGSEPEVQAMMALIDAHEFITSQSFHSYSNLTLYPWGYTGDPSPHDAVLAQMAQTMTRYNGYTPQRAAALYPANGTTADWIYGDLTGHPLCLAFSNEIGGPSDGFWPAESRRDALFEENLWPSLFQIMAADHYLEAHTAQVSGGNGDEFLDPGETAEISFHVENFGIANSATGVTVTLSSADPYLQLLEAERALADLAPMEIRDLATTAFAVLVDAACPAGRILDVNVHLDWDGQGSDYVLEYRTGAPQTLLTDDLESGTANWSLGGNWALTTSTSHSPSNSLTDSPSGNYPDSAISSATLTIPGLLGSGAGLSFWQRYSIEDGWDYGYVRISADGTNWSTVASVTGLQSSWVQQDVDLSAWAGLPVQVRFELESDYSITADGWYLDDLELTGYGNPNQLPPAPSLVYPGPDETVPMIPGFTVTTVSDPDSADPVTYGYRIYTDAACTQLLTYVDDHPYHFWTPNLGVLQPGTQYWWRAYAADSQARGLLSDVASFTTLVPSSSVPGRGGALSLELLDPTGATHMRFSLGLPRDGKVTVRVFNARGQLIRSLAGVELGAGAHVLDWDGRDRGGRQAASGVYFVNARQGSQAVTRRVLLVR